jgi:uncharacterized membrane protein YwaF
VEVWQPTTTIAKAICRVVSMVTTNTNAVPIRLCTLQIQIGAMAFRMDGRNEIR